MTINNFMRNTTRKGNALGFESNLAEKENNELLKRLKCQFPVLSLFLYVYYKWDVGSFCY